MKSSAYKIAELLKKIVSLRGGKVKYFVKHKSISYEEDLHSLRFFINSNY